MKGNNKSLGKKILSWLLIACMCFGVIPAYVLDTRAAEETEFAELEASSMQYKMNQLVEEGYRVVTPLTFGVPDTVGTHVPEVGDEISLDKLLISANVSTISGGTAHLYFLKSTGRVFQLSYQNGGTRMYFYNYFEYATKTSAMYFGDSSEVPEGTTIENARTANGKYATLRANHLTGVVSNFYNTHQIWITTEFVDMQYNDDDEAIDDLKIGVYFNGVLYDGDYFYVKDCKDLTYKEHVETSSRTTFSSPIMQLSDLDMIGGEYKSELKTSALVSNTVEGGTNKVMDGTTFQSSVRFEGEGGTLYYGSNDIDNAVQLTSIADGIQISYGAEKLGYINKNNVGFDVLNKNFDLKLTTKAIDGNADDMQLDVCVDNKYASFTLAGAASTLTAHVGVKTEGNATVLVGDFASEEPEQITWDLETETEDFTIARTDTMTRLSVNGVSVAGDIVLKDPGTYSVAITENGKVSMKDVTILAAKADPASAGTLTFADFGYTDKTYEGGLAASTLKTIASDKVDTVSLINSEFRGYLQFHADGRTVTNAAILLLGGDDSTSNGVRIQFMPTGELKVDTTKIAGQGGTEYTYALAEGIFETKFKFTLSFETADADDDGRDDLLMKVYVNDELCSAEDTYILDYISSSLLGKMSVSGVSATDTASYKSVTIESCELPYNYTTTFADYGISNQTYGPNMTHIGSDFPGTMEYMKFSGHVTLGATDDSDKIGIVYGNNSDSSYSVSYIRGLYMEVLAASGDVFIYNNLNPEGGFLNQTHGGKLTAALPTDGSGFDISFNTIPWDYDGDGVATDGKIEIRVNGKLLKDKYFIIGGIFAEGVTVTNRVRLLGQNQYGGTATMTVASETSDTKRLRKLELADFALADGTYDTQNYTAGEGPSSLLNTILEVNVNVTESASGSQIHYAIPSDSSDGWHGTRLAITGNEIKISSADGTLTVNSASIQPSEMQKDTFYGKTLKLGLSVEKVDIQGDGNNNDARLGIWLNGKLHRNYYYVDGADDVGTGMSLMSYVDETDKGTAKVTISDVTEVTTSFTKTLGLEDMNKTGVAAGVYGYYPENLETKTLAVKQNWGNTGDLDNSIFSTNIRFSGKNVHLMYGCSGLSGMGYHSIWVRSTGNEAKAFQVSYNGSDAKTLEAGIAGVKFYDNTFKLSISSRAVDSDGDDVFDDLEVGFWFNDVLYGNTYIYIQDKGDALDPNIAVRSTSSDVNKQGYLVLGNYTQEQATEVVHCADEFAYFADGNEVTVGNQSKGNSWNTQVPGEYAVTYTNTTSMGTSTFKENVLVYKTNDITADGVVDVKDLVALKKLAAGERAETSNAGKKAVSYSEDADWYTTEVKENMYARLLADKNILQAKKMSDEILGETGSLTPDGKATYITNLALTEEGTSVISISDVADEASRSYTTNVAALNGSGLDFVLDFDTDRKIKVLQISDPQVIVREEVAEYKASNKDNMLYNELKTLVETEKPDLILIVGDIIFGRYDTDGTLLNEIIAAMDGFKIPWAPIYGNHDNESAMGVTWQCNRFMESKYCLFNRRHDIGGNGNYTIGIAVQGELQRTIFMMDTNGCSYANRPEAEAVTASFVLHDEQIAWYRTTAARMKQFAGADVPSFLCTHVAPGEVAAAYTKEGYQEKTDIDLAGATGFHMYNVGEIVQDGTKWTYEKDEKGNFGFKNSTTTTSGSLNEFILPYLKEAGTDGTFSGHVHLTSLSVEWEGIRWTLGLKTGLYDGNPNETGGTVILLDKKEFDVNHSIINIIEE